MEKKMSNDIKIIKKFNIHKLNVETDINLLFSIPISVYDLKTVFWLVIDTNICESIVESTYKRLIK